MEKIFDNKFVSVYYDEKNHDYILKSCMCETIIGNTYTLRDVTTLDEKTTLELITAIAENMFITAPLPLAVGDHVKVLGNSPETAWETGCIEYIDGEMAHIVYGVKTLDEFGGIRGMGYPVPISQLRRIL